MKKIAVLGSTGSIGTQTLAVAAMYPEKLKVTGLAAGSNWRLLLEQIQAFHPEKASIESEEGYRLLKPLMPVGTTLIGGRDAMLQIAGMDGADTLLVAVVGIAGLPGVMEGIRTGKAIALANKEALITGGALVTEAARQRSIPIYPVDSEHSAIFQCLQGRAGNPIRKIILTCSGGPFRTWSEEKLQHATARDALQHPTWNMGNKITIDCATLMNKGLEVMEAKWLFDVDVDRICPLIHPESVVHSAVEFEDGAVIAQMGEPDMRLPILYALEYPHRLPCGAKPLDLAARGTLTFAEPDTGRFPCLLLAKEAMKMGGTAPTVLNAANEVAVARFLEGKIGFGDIPRLIEHTIFHTDILSTPTMQEIYETDAAVRAAI